MQTSILQISCPILHLVQKTIIPWVLMLVLLYILSRNYKIRNRSSIIYIPMLKEKERERKDMIARGETLQVYAGQKDERCACARRKGRERMGTVRVEGSFCASLAYVCVCVLYTYTKASDESLPRRGTFFRVRRRKFLPMDILIRLSKFAFLIGFYSLSFIFFYLSQSVCMFVYISL